MRATSNHAYLRTHKISGDVLRFQLSVEERRLREQAAAAKSGRSGKTLVKEGRLRITEVALRKGTLLGAHHVAGAVSMQTRQGRLRVTTGGGKVDLGPGELAVLDAEVIHSAQALSDCVILITTAMP